MTRLEQLTAMRDAVRDDATCITGMVFDLFGSREIAGLMTRATDRDMNAALALFSALLPGWGWGAGPWGARVWEYSDNPNWDGSNRQEVELIDDPARALLLATLEALIKKEEG